MHKPLEPSCSTRPTRQAEAWKCSAFWRALRRALWPCQLLRRALRYTARELHGQRAVPVTAPTSSRSAAAGLGTSGPPPGSESRIPRRSTGIDRGGLGVPRIEGSRTVPLRCMTRIRRSESCVGVGGPGRDSGRRGRLGCGLRTRTQPRPIPVHDTAPGVWASGGRKGAHSALRSGSRSHFVAYGGSGSDLGCEAGRFHCGLRKAIAWGAVRKATQALRPGRHALGQRRRRALRLLVAAAQGRNRYSP